MWLGLLAIGLLGGTAALMGLDVLTSVDFPSSFWNKALPDRPDAGIMAWLYLSGVLALLADLLPRRVPAASIWLWHWPLGLLAFTTWWVYAVGFPAGVLTYGWPTVLIWLAYWWEPQEHADELG